MTSRDLRTLLDAVPDTLEIVLRGPHGRPGSGPVHEAWRAGAALRRDAYAAYRAAQDREDAAQDALSSAVAGRAPARAA
jgi:hypothetical protein